MLPEIIMEVDGTTGFVFGFQAHRFEAMPSTSIIPSGRVCPIYYPVVVIAGRTSSKIENP